jgi:hypothetical protein
VDPNATESVNRDSIDMTQISYISQMPQMLHEVANETVVQIGAHQIGTSWRACQHTAAGEVKKERHRPATDCSDEIVLCIFEDVQ